MAGDVSDDDGAPVRPELETGCEIAAAVGFGERVRFDPGAHCGAPVAASRCLRSDRGHSVQMDRHVEPSLNVTDCTVHAAEPLYAGLVDGAKSCVIAVPLENVPAASMSWQRW